MQAIEKVRPARGRWASKALGTGLNPSADVIITQFVKKHNYKPDAHLTYPVRSLAVILAPSIETARRNHWTAVVRALVALVERDRRRTCNQ